MKIHYFHKAFFLLAFSLVLHPAWAQTVTIQQPLASTPVSCFGANDGTITVAIDTSDGDVAAPFTYTLVRISPSVLVVPSISSSALTVTFTGLAPGAYVAAVQDANGVDDPSGPVVSVGNRTPVATAISGSVTNPVCAGAATGAFTVRGSGGVNTTFDFEITGPSFPTGSGFVGSGTRTHTFTGLLAGTYSVVAQDTNGCNDITPLTIVISQPPALAVTVAAQTSPACAGSATGTIGLSATGGTAPYQYSLDGTSFQPSASFTGLPAGSYTLTVRDANNCTATVTNTLTEPPALQITLGTQANITGCFGDATGEIQVTATGGTAPYTYSSNGGPFTANSGTFSGLPAGSYAITVRDANGCTQPLAPVVISQPAQLAATVASQTNIPGCFGDSTGTIGLSATGGTAPYQYSLNGGAFQASASFTGLPAGSYTLTVRDANNCTATATATLTQPAVLSMTLSPQNPTCSGTATGSISVVAAGGTPAYQYAVNGGAFQPSASFTGLAAGSYTVTVRDGQNCEKTLAVTLTAPAALALSVAARQDVQNCFGEASGSLTLAATGGTAPYSYSTGGAFQPSASFTGLPAGSYTLTVRDANNCTATATAAITQPALLTLATTGQTNIAGCNGDATGSITVAAAGGTVGYQYSLDGATFGPGNVFSGLSAGSYTLTVRDSKGCTATATATLTQPAPLSAAVPARTDVLCFGAATGSLTVAATGGTSPYSYSADGVTFQASNVFAGLVAGSYTLTVRDANNCTATATAVLTQPVQLASSLAAKRDVTCGGGSDGSITVSATGGVAPYGYSLDGTTFTANGGAFTGLPAGSYTVTVRDANGCTAAVANVVVAQPAVLQLAAAATDAACSGTATGSVTASATGGAAPYQYSLNGGAFQASAAFSGLAAGSYTLTVRDANGCTATATAAIAQPALLTLATTGQTNIAGCNGDATGSITVAAAGGTAGYQYSLDGATFGPGNVFSGLPAGSYTLTVRDSKGCTATATATLTQPAPLSAAVPARTDVLCFGAATGSLTLAASGGVVPYQYSIGGAFQASNVFSGLVAGSYAVTVRDANGCTATATAAIAQPAAQLGVALLSKRDVSCFGQTTGGLTVSATGGTAPYGYSTDGVNFAANGGVFNALPAGSYTLTVRDANGCTASTTANIAQPALLALAATSTDVTCNGGADGSAGVTATGGAAPYTYAWNTVPARNTATANGLRAGTYSVTVTDANGCSNALTVTIAEPAVVAAPVAASPAPLCTGQPVPALTATGTGLRWYADVALSVSAGTGGTFTPAVDNTVAGSTVFYVTQTVGGCQSAATAVTLTYAPAPARPAVGGDTLLCNGGSVVLTSSAATGNQWLLAGSPIAGATVQTLTVTAPGQYSVRVTQGACQAVSTPVSVAQSDLSAAATASNPSCSDPNSGVITVAATGGTAPYRYSLDGNDFSNTSGLFSGLSANTYTVHIRDANNCTITRNASVAAVTGIASATATAANESGCGLADGTLTLSGITGAAGPYQYFLNGVPNPAGAGVAVFSGLAPATYTVRVLAANGCDFTVATTVGTDCVTCTLAATVAAQAGPTCNGRDGSITLASSGGVGTVRYSIDGGLNFNTNPAFTGLAAGDYPVAVRDGNGCTVADTVTLDAPVSIAAVVTGSNPSTCGVNDGTLTVSNVTGGTAPYRYSLDGINYQGGAVFSGLSGNSYTVSVRDATGCTATFTQLITAPNGITSVTTNTQSESGCASTDGSISVTVLGGRSPYRYFINGTANPAGVNASVFSGLAGGVYAIRVETADGCSFSTTAAVGTNCTTPCTLAATLTAAGTLCHDGTDGQITVAASGGTGLYEYSLDGTTFQPAALFAGLSPGNYTVTIRDRNNPACRITGTATLINPAALSVSVAAQANPACTNTGGSLTVSGAGGSGALAYSLNGGAFSANAAFTGLAAGSYTVTVRDANGCTATVTAALSLPAGIVATLSKTDPSACNVADGQVQVGGVLNGTAPYEYSLDGLVFQPSATFTGLAEGAYTVRIRDAAGCAATLASVTLRANVTLAATVTSANASSCAVADGTLTVGGPTGGTAPYQYSIGGPFQASNVFTGLGAGSYTVTLRDANGCTQPLPGTTITAPNSITAISLSAADETACSLRDGRISVASVTGGTAPYQYFINGSLNPTGANASLFTGLAGGTYLIRVVTADGCDFTATATVAAACCLQASIGTRTNPSCAGNDGGIVVSATGGAGSVKYSIDGGGTFQASATFTGLAAGTYTVVVSDSLCQRAAGTVTLTGTQLAATVAGTSPSGCSATNGAITVTAPSGGTAPYQYSLDGVTYGASGTFSGLSSGGYTVFLRDAAGCTATFTETLAPTGGILTIQTGTVSETGCNLRDGAVTVTGVTGAGGPYQYFIDGTLNPAGANNNVFAGLASGPHTVRVVAANGCDFSATVVVGSNCTATCTLAASLSAQTDPTCTAPLGGFTVTATNGTGTLEYSLDGTAFQASNVFTGLAAGSYTVTVRDAAGCRTTVAATLAATATLSAVVAATNPSTCDASDGTLAVSNPTGGVAPYQYSLTGASYQANGIFGNLSNGAYTVYVRDANGCVVAFARTLTTPAAVAATVSAADETTCQANDGSVTVAGVTGGTAPYRYFINGLGNPAGVNNPVFGGLSPGSYSIRVISADGCRYTTNVQIGAAPCSPPCTLAASLLYANPNCTAPASGLVTISASGGTAPYQYSLNGAAFAPGTGDFQNLAPGRYDLVVRDAAGCQIALPSVQLMAPQGPNNLQATATAPTACSATDGRITVTGVSGGTVPYLYSLDGTAYGADNEFRSLAPGSYTVFVRDANQCVFSRQVSLASPGGLSATAAVTAESACAAGDGRATLTVTGATGAVEYRIDGAANPAGGGNATFTGLAPGSYTLSAQDAANCRFSVSITIGAAVCPPCSLSASVTTQTPPTCASPSGGAFTVTAANGTAPYQYSLDGGAFAPGTGVFSGLPAGSHSVIVRDAAGCTDTLAPVVFTLPVINFTATGTNPGACRTSDGTLTAGTPTGGTAPYSYSLDGVNFSNTSGVFIGLAAGSYTVTARDANGCTATATQVLSAASGLTATLSATGETACRAANGSVTVSVSGGTAPFQYFINGSANPAGSGNNVFAGLAPGSYVIRILDAAGCEFSTSATIGSFACPPCALAVSLSSKTDPTCANPAGGSFTVAAANGTGTLEYSLDGTAFQASNVFTGLAAGSYTVTVRDAAGCTATLAPVVFTLPTVALVVTGTNLTSCTASDGRITANPPSGGTAPYAYSLDGAAFANTTGQFTGLAAGSYTVTVRDANGCTATATQVLSAPSGVTATLSATGETACRAADGSVAVSATGGTAPYRYSLDGGAFQAAGTFTGLAPGLRTVRVADAAGCEFTLSASVPAFACPPCTLSASLSAQAGPVCFGQATGTVTVSATGGTAPFQYSIDGGTFQAAATFGSLRAGTYTLTVRDAGNCTATVTATLAQPAALALAATAAGASCAGTADGSVTASATGGTAPYQYSLDGGAFQASAAFTGLAAGSYTLTVRDANGCTAPATATVGQPALVPVPVLSGTPAFCAGGGTVLTSSAATGNQWLLEGTPIAGATAQTLAVTAAGNYAVRVTAGGCAATSAVLAVVQTSVTATFATTDVTACAATDGTLTVGNATGGTAPYTYSIGGAFQTSNVFTGLAAGTYTVTVRDAAGCTFGGTANVTAPAGFTATVTATGETACRAADGRLTASVSGGTAPFRYSIGGAFQAGNLFTGLAPGAYTLRVTDAAGCEFSATATVAAFACPPPVCVLTAQAFSNPVLCNGVSDGTAILVNVAGGSGSYEFSIDNGASYQAGPQFNSLAAGSYTILVRDRTQPACTASFPVVVATRFDVAGIIIVNQPKTCGEKGKITFTNVFGGQAPYQFSVDGTTFAADTVFDNLIPGAYKATIRDAKGCQFAATIAIVGGEAITATVAQGRQASCGQADGTITVTNAAGGSGVFVYSLDGSTFAGNTTFTGLAAGAYTVYIKEQNGTCVATFPVTVTAAACCQLAVTPTLGQPTACASADGRIELAVANGAAPFTYRLNNGTVQNSSVFGGLGNGSYLVLVRDANGCEATVSVSLASPNALTAQAEQVTPVSCFGQADGTARLFNVTGGSNNTNNYEYSQDGTTYQNAPLFTGLRAGVYVLFVRDKMNGCSASYPVTVTGAAQITAVLTPANPTVCAAKDGEIGIGAVTGGVGPYTYSLDSLTGYQATPRFSNLGNGTYTVYVKDSRGCLAVYPVRLSSPNAVTVANPSLINPTCQGSNNGEIRMGNAGGGQPPYQYAVNGGLYQATGTFAGLRAGTHVVTVKDASGCEYPFTYLLTEPATIVFEVKQTRESTCADPAGAVEVTNPVGGIPPYRFSLNGLDYQASPVFEALQPGDYTMHVRDASRNTCASTKPFTIRGARNVAYEVAVADIGCSGSEKGKITLRKITGGVEAGAAVEYEVSINGGRTFRPVKADSVVFDNLDEGLYDIVIGYGAGCRTAARRVTLNAGAIAFDVTATAASCGADNGSASAAIANPIPGKTYYYSLDSLNFFTTPNFPNLKAGTYKMYLRENPRDLCSNIRTFTVPGPDSVRYALRRQDCSQVLVDSLRGGVAPYVVKLTGRRNVTTGTLFANRYDFGSLPDGDYTITVTDAAGCGTLPFSFRVGNRIAYKVKTTPSVAEEPTGGVLIEDITGGQRPYEVSVDGQNWAVIKDKSIPIDTLVTELPVGLLTVYVRDANGCVQAMNTEITELKFVVPNIFTPNGDGVNDTFFITKLPLGTFVKIVDRWGRTVFETRDYKNEWDGGSYPDGIYYYTIDIAGEQTWKGWVQIWR